MSDGSNRPTTGTAVPPICATCRQKPAAWMATFDRHGRAEPESWPVCGRCKEQAERLTTVAHRPLAAA